MEKTWAQFNRKKFLTSIITINNIFYYLLKNIFPIATTNYNFFAILLLLFDDL